mmetsp:Transcript_416/g.381  ORF Transcript_416/g.381 Transcript_416/m.381 type:complete len:124 (-) Transcript_416:157-528(-)
MNTPLVIKKTYDPNHFAFRQVKDPVNQRKAICPLAEKVQEAYPELAGYDFVNKLNRSNGIGMLVADNTHGLLWYALANRLLCFHGAKAFKLLTEGVSSDVKSLAKSTKQFGGDIDLIKLSPSN